MNKELDNIQLLKDLEEDFRANFSKAYSDDIYSKNYFNFYDNYKNDKEALVDFSDLEYQYLRYTKISIFLRLKYIWYKEHDERISNNLLDDISAFIVYTGKKDILNKINSSENFCISLLNGFSKIEGYDIDNSDDTGLLPENVENKLNTVDLILAKSDEASDSEIYDIGISYELAENYIDEYLELIEASGHIDKAILDKIKSTYKELEKIYNEKYLIDFVKLLAISQVLSIPYYQKFREATIEAKDFYSLFEDYLNIREFIDDFLIKKGVYDFE